MSRPRLLIVRLGALGDVVLALPALRLLRRSLPEAGLGWLVEERNAALLQGHPDLNALYVARADRWRGRPLASETRRELGSLVRALRRERFELALDLQGLVKSALWARLAGARRVLGLPPGRLRERASGLLLSGRAPLPSGSEHVTELYLEAAREAVRQLGATPVEGSESGCLALRAEERARASARLAAHGLVPGRFVVLNPGAAWVTKRWEPRRFGELARELASRHRLGLLVVTGPGEEPLARALVEAARPAAVVSFPTGVRELAAIAEPAALFVSGDTGPYHIARALGVATVGLFGPTDPARNGPRSPRDRVAWARVPCSPCYGRTCPTAIECMSALETGQVLAIAEELLSISTGPATSGGTAPFPV